MGERFRAQWNSCCLLQLGKEDSGIYLHNVAFFLNLFKDHLHWLEMREKWMKNAYHWRWEESQKGRKVIEAESWSYIWGIGWWLMAGIEQFFKRYDWMVFASARLYTLHTTDWMIRSCRFQEHVYTGSSPWLEWVKHKKVPKQIWQRAFWMLPNI